ncbi:MAG: tetratricopeptide repeat protein [Verrucomicrobiota bacterium]
MIRWTFLPILASTAWMNFWFSPDQQGQRLMMQERPAEAAARFRDPIHQGTAWYRAGEFEKAEQAFARVGTADAEYNRGNCLIFLGQYESAIERFDRALQLRPEWDDAVNNRAIAVARAEATKAEGGDMGDQKIGADEIRFDNDQKPGGQDTEVNEDQAASNQRVQELWLRRMQTRPSDFLRAKFSYQLAVGDTEEGEAL